MDGGLTPQEFGAGTPVAIYLRVSSDEQVEGFSLSAQTRACREFAERRNWQVVKVYEDPGESGKNDRRPGFQTMLHGAQAGEFKVLLVHKLDRFSRNIDTTLKYFRELNNCDVTVASVTEDFDYSTPMGRMFFRMMAVFAQWYLENLSAETVKGKRERAKQGLHNGRVPFGYAISADHRVAQVVPDEAIILKKAFEMYSTGEYTDRQIAAYLNFYYYKEASPERGLTCEHGGKSVRMDRADVQVLNILKTIRLPEDWQDILEQRARDVNEVAKMETRRNPLQDQLRRLSRRYQDGLVTDDEYERSRDQIRAELDRLVIPDTAQSVDLGLRIEALAWYLDEATEAERSEIVHLMLESIHYDLAAEKIVRFRPKSELMFLFQLIGRELGWHEEPDGSFRL